MSNVITLNQFNHFRVHWTQTKVIAARSLDTFANQLHCLALSCITVFPFVNVKHPSISLKSQVYHIAVSMPSTVTLEKTHCSSSRLENVHQDHKKGIPPPTSQKELQQSSGIRIPTVFIHTVLPFIKIQQSWYFCCFSCLSLCIYKRSSVFCCITHYHSLSNTEPVVPGVGSGGSVGAAEREPGSFWSQGIYTANTQTGSYHNHINMPVAKTVPLHTTSETDGIKENRWGAQKSFWDLAGITFKHFTNVYLVWTMTL